MDVPDDVYLVTPKGRPKLRKSQQVVLCGFTERPWRELRPGCDPSGPSAPSEEEPDPMPLPRSAPHERPATAEARPGAGCHLRGAAVM